MKYAVPDFDRYTIREIAESIVDIYPRENENAAERLHGKIDLLNTESGEPGGKLIRMDMVFAIRFEVRLPGNRQIDYVNVTIDFEMQYGKPQEYKLAPRGVYYSASFLRDTLKSAEGYSNIHIQGGAVPLLIWSLEPRDEGILQRNPQKRGSLHSLLR